MLRIHQQSSAADAKSYFTREDYFVNQQELVGRWRGEGAKLLGLSGDVKHDQWSSLCDGIDPTDGKKLLQRLKGNRTVGYDFTFSAPKSVSLLYGMTKDERLLNAFRDAVDDTMQDIQADAKTRVRKEGRNEDRLTQNLLWGEFVHLTSRPVDGIVDPQMHAHCFAFNTTFDSEEGRFKAGQFRDLKRDGPYYEALFHSRLSHHLTELGLPIERTRTGWELAGVSRPFVEKFSRRTLLIEEQARIKGIVDPKEKAELGAKTRSRKAKHFTMSELQDEWRDRMSPAEAASLDRLQALLGGDAQPQDGNAARLAMDHAIEHEFERRSVVPQRRLLATALKHAVGQATPALITQAFNSGGIIVGERDGRSVATTHNVLAEEERIVGFAKAGRGTCKPLGGGGSRTAGSHLDVSQQAAVKHILESRDRVTIVRGVAGSGKTTLMKEAVAAIESSGTVVQPLAPTADASRGVLRGEGFTGADTVARFLLDESMQQKCKGALLWIDEAGLIGAKTMSRVFELAEKLDCRVLLTGDRRQHGSVEHGAVLQLLEDEAGLKPAEVKNIKRQAGEYKAAVKALSEGRTCEGFDRLDKLGWICELPGEERYKQLAGDYVDSVRSGKKVLVIAPTHIEGQRITGEIRRSLQAKGMIGRKEQSFRVLVNAQLTEAERRDSVNYRPGDVLVFHQNAKGYQRGQRITVQGGELPLDQANRFSLFHSRTLPLAAGDTIRITHNGMTADGKHHLNNGALYRIKTFDRGGNIVLENNWTIDKDFGHLAYGVVITSHASQGRTYDRILLAQSSQSFPASSREQFYVSASRGRESIRIFCDDKEALRAAIDQSEDRSTATELFAALRRQQLAAEYNREQEATRERTQELIHAR